MRWVTWETDAALVQLKWLKKEFMKKEKEESVMSLSDISSWANLITWQECNAVTKYKVRNSYPSCRRDSIFVHTSVKWADNSVLFRLYTAKEKT